MVQPCVSYPISLERESLTISTAAAQMLKRLFCVPDSCLGEAYVPGCLASGDNCKLDLSYSAAFLSHPGPTGLWMEYRSLSSKEWG